MYFISKYKNSKIAKEKISLDTKKIYSRLSHSLSVITSSKNSYIIYRCFITLVFAYVIQSTRKNT